jgi:hypothetical protein
MVASKQTQDAPTRLAIKVVPGASRSELCGWLGDMLKVRISAAPEKGKANVAVVALLADRLGISKKSLTIVSGKSSQQKLVEIHGLSILDVMQKLNDVSE